MFQRRSSFLVCLILFSFFWLSGTKEDAMYPVSASKKMLAVFYNVENLFDTENHPEKNDDEYTPESDKHWTKSRYYKKLNNIYKVLSGIGQWDMPDIIGLSEIENRKVLEDLLSATPLSKYSYGIVHQDSPDKRGIDVALLYHQKTIDLLESDFLSVVFENDERPTREILYSKVLNRQNDTIHVFVNHWPSRWGGKEKSAPKRMDAAKVLKNKTDSLLKTNPNVKIIITGDFNDEPTDKSLLEGLGAKINVPEEIDDGLYNLSAKYVKDLSSGTHCYKGEWGVLDQFIVSSALLQGDIRSETNIYKASFLLKEDEEYLTSKPFRTYAGPNYLGGFSDHLPICLTVNYQ